MSDADGAPRAAPSPHDVDKNKCCFPLPSDRLAPEEIAGVPEMLHHRDLQLEMRRMIMYHWHDNPVSCISPAHLSRQYPQESERAFLAVVVHFLERFGYINIGLVARSANEAPLYFKPPDVTPRVIVVGAGFAGLACASQLQRFGYAVTVLEARDRVGGRCHTAQIDGHMAQLGSLTMLGTHGNPLWALVRQLQWEVHQVDTAHCKIYGTLGERAETSALEIDDAWLSVLDELETHAKRLGPEYAGVLPAGPALARAAARRPASVRRWLAWRQAIREDREHAPADMISLDAWDPPEGSGGKEVFGAYIMLSRGFQAAAEVLSQTLDVRLNAPVAAVDHSDPSRVVVTIGAESLSADAVVCTLPLGVLRVRSVEFTPPLPSEKIEAIGRVRSGASHRLALVFAHAWWEGKMELNGVHCLTDIDRGLYFQFFHMEPRSPVLVVVAAGKGASGEHGRPADGLGAHAMAALRQIAAPLQLVVDDPVTTQVTDWGADPFAAGSGPYVPPGGSLEDLGVLARPVGGNLFFAGDATEPRCPGTMTGAYLSGLRAAGEICDRFCPRKRERIATGAGIHTGLVPQTSGHPSNGNQAPGLSTAAKQPPPRPHVLVAPAPAQRPYGNTPAPLRQASPQGPAQAVTTPLPDASATSSWYQDQDSVLRAVLSIPKFKRPAPAGAAEDTPAFKVPKTPATRTPTWRQSPGIPKQVTREIVQVVQDQPKSRNKVEFTAPICLRNGRPTCPLALPDPTPSRRGPVGLDLRLGEYRDSSDSPLALAREAKINANLQRLRTMTPAEVERAFRGKASAVASALALQRSLGNPHSSEDAESSWSRRPSPAPAKPGPAPARPSSLLERAEKTASIWAPKTVPQLSAKSGSRDLSAGQSYQDVLEAAQQRQALERRAQNEVHRGVAEVVRSQMARLPRDVTKPVADAQTLKAQAKALAAEVEAQLQAWQQTTGRPCAWDSVSCQQAVLLCQRSLGVVHASHRRTAHRAKHSIDDDPPRYPSSEDVEDEPQLTMARSPTLSVGPPQDQNQLYSPSIAADPAEEPYRFSPPPALAAGHASVGDWDTDLDPLR